MRSSNEVALGLFLVVACATSDSNVDDLNGAPLSKLLGPQKLIGNERNGTNHTQPATNDRLLVTTRDADKLAHQKVEHTKQTQSRKQVRGLDVSSDDFRTFKNTRRCGTSHQYGKVVNVSDGYHDRCFSIVSPPDLATERPIPILFYFHASTSDASHCGSGRYKELGDLAVANAFAVVCAEGLQDYHGSGGRWIFPEIVTDQTGNRCMDKDSVDLVYLKNILKKLKMDGRYDTQRLFFSGCSMGSQFGMYATMCFKEFAPSSVSAFATHSSGLKVKGDGLEFPPDSYHPAYTWGECPECQYSPVVPTKFDDTVGLKACVFDNVGDTPEFYSSSMALANYWKALNMTVESHLLGLGGHCEINSWRSIVGCLDAGTGRLMPNAKTMRKSLADLERKRLKRLNERQAVKQRGVNAAEATTTSGSANRAQDEKKAKDTGNSSSTWSRAASTMSGPHNSALKRLGKQLDQALAVLKDSNVGDVLD